MIESASVHPGAFSISGTSTQPRRIKDAGYAAPALRSPLA